MKKLKILFEDKNLLIVYKDGNIPTINSEKYSKSLYNEVYDYLHKKNQKVFVVHRLDKDTSGLVMFAKNERVKEVLQDNWENVRRKYIALVHGIIKEDGVIKSYLKETKTLLTYSTNDKSGKYSETIYKRLEYNKQYSLVEIEIKTGRKNQIRVHTESINHPIVGDKKYNSKKNPIRRMCLHATYLEFTHPVTNKRIVINDNYPEMFDKLLG